MADGTGNGNQLVSFFQDPPKKRSSNSLGIELLPIERANGFVLPGPAVAGIVYVRHPGDKHELVTFADYDERLAQDRYDEVLRVFTSLGAARIVARSHRQTTRHALGRFHLRGKGLTIGAGKDTGWSLAADMEGDGGPAVDPRPLRYGDIPALDTVCEGVLKLGWKKGRIQITKSSTLGVDGELATRLRDAGFKLGVSGTKATVTEFVIEAAFTPEASKALDTVVAKTAPDPTPRRRSFLRRRPPSADLVNG
jgi:hypothetical protein